MNIKTSNWKDLINDQPFTRKDIITIQDPSNAMKFNLSSFHHIKNNIRMEDEGKLLINIHSLFSIDFLLLRVKFLKFFVETARERNNPNARLKTVSVETKEILSELEKNYKPTTSGTKDEASMKKADKFNAVCILFIKTFFILIVENNLTVYFYVGTLFYWRSCCWIYFNSDASGDHPSSSCDRRRFGTVRKSQEKGYVIAILC